MAERTIMIIALPEFTTDAIDAAIEAAKLYPAFAREEYWALDRDGNGVRIFPESQDGRLVFTFTSFYPSLRYTPEAAAFLAMYGDLTPHQALSKIADIVIR